MDVQDILFSSEVSRSLEDAVLDLMDSNPCIYPYTLVLTPTATNDDVNGSQHAHNGGTDFTYREADMDDVAGASALGYYEYFSNYGTEYTGHYYNGDGRHFEAVVIDPPAYAATHAV